jgi:hypothetical protein
VVGLLAEGPSYGYELKAKFEERTLDHTHQDEPGSRPWVVSRFWGSAEGD